MKWISVKERLPEKEEGMYLVTLKKYDHNSTIPLYWQECWTYDEETDTDIIGWSWVDWDNYNEEMVQYDDQVIAWMPFPDPYEESNQEES